MSFFTLIFKNIWRNKIRTILTVLGISIGIATIVVFGLATSGLKDMIGDMIKPGETDFTVAKAGSADIVLSFLNYEQVDKIRNIDGIENVVTYVMSLAPVDGNPFFVVGGVDKENLKLAGMDVIEGRAFQNDNEAVIGKITAKTKDLGVGDTIVINEKTYDVVGIFESGISFQDSGAIMTTQESQKIQGITDKVNMIMVQVERGLNIREVADAVEAADEEFVSVVDLGDFESIDQGTQMMDAVAWAISVLAIVIGGIGVMNTIIMSVFERTREIGVLRAVGWKRRRIIAMILGESLIEGVMAAVIGMIIGVALILIVLQTDLGKSWLQVNYEFAIFAQAFVVSLVVVLVGAIYPSYKASKLKPTEALRYE